MRSDIELELALIYIGMVFLGTIGWIINIVKLFHETDSTWFIGRLVGIFIPIIGAVVGWM